VKRRLNIGWRERALTLALLLLFSVTAGALEYPKLKPTTPAVQQPAVESKAVPEATPATPGGLLDRAVDPKAYIVGPGDVFAISLYGVTTVPINVEVLPEGIVSLPDVGEVKVGQLTLAEAKQQITNALTSRYRDRAIGVALARVRTFKISVSGAVERPGIVTVSAADRVSEAIALAGGIQKKGSQRNIMLVNIGRDTVTTDLASFNSTGNVDANPYLHEGQVIFVPVVSDSLNKIEIYGAVNAPGVFEFRSGDRLADLLALGFGLSVDADLDGSELVRFSADGMKHSLTVDLRAALADRRSEANIFLAPDDRVFVRALAGFRLKEQVTILGEVKYPGVYPIRDGTRTLSDLVDKAGGFLPEASLSESEMIRKSMYGATEAKTSFDQLLMMSTDKLTDFELQYLKETSSRKPGKVAINFELLFERKLVEHDVPLMDGDIVTIPRKSFAVTVLGRVVNPGLVPYKESETLEYYVRLAGGYGYKANKHDIRLIKANTGALIKADRNTEVAMGDKIMVPQKKGINIWQLFKDTSFFIANLATIYLVINQATK
jgi:polysaccharide biosynthesis/export protein